MINLSFMTCLSSVTACHGRVEIQVTNNASFRDGYIENPCNELAEKSEVVEISVFMTSSSYRFF